MNDETTPGTTSDIGVLRVTKNLTIPMRDFSWRFSGSGGPGGQHANTSNTRVELVFDAQATAALGPRQRERIVESLGMVIRVTASDTRSQARSTSDASRLMQHFRAAIQ